MTNQEIIDYVIESPNNTNPAILNQMLDELNVSNVVIIEGSRSSDRTMTIGNETFLLNYDNGEDWYPVRNSRLYSILKSMIPLNMPRFYIKEEGSYGITYTLYDYEIRVSEDSILLGGDISIANID